MSHRIFGDIIYPPQRCEMLSIILQSWAYIHLIEDSRSTEEMLPGVKGLKQEGGSEEYLTYITDAQVSPGTEGYTPRDRVMMPRGRPLKEERWQSMGLMWCSRWMPLPDMAHFYWWRTFQRWRMWI